jgi:hypothetical protein
VQCPYEMSDWLVLRPCRKWINWQHQKVLLAITRCRTAALGGHRDRCTSCGHTTRISYNSCRNRHCTRCQGNARRRWLKARANASFCPLATYMLSSRCRGNSLGCQPLQRPHKALAKQHAAPSGPSVIRRCPTQSVPDPSAPVQTDSKYIGFREGGFLQVAVSEAPPLRPRSRALLPDGALQIQH